MTAPTVPDREADYCIHSNHDGPDGERALSVYPAGDEDGVGLPLAVFPYDEDAPDDHSNSEANAEARANWFLSALAPQAPAEWRTIETLPEERGPYYLMFGDGVGFKRCAFVGLHDGMSWVTAFGSRRCVPTHWQPLPAPPLPTGAGDERG